MHLIYQKDSADSFVWECASSSCNRKRLSVREGSFFARTHLSLKQVVLMMYEWSCDSMVAIMAKEAQVSRRVAMMYASAFRKLGQFYVESQSQAKIGGVGSILEIDETLVARRKYNVGRRVEQRWLFGGVVRGSRPTVCFLEEVPNRSGKPC